jgi:tetratricopeptide (TPR) repeat protein
MLLGIGIAAAQDAQWQETMARALAAERNMNYAEAVSLYRQAKTLADRFPANDARRWSTYNHLGIACEEAGIPADGVRVYREAAALIKSAAGANNRDYAAALANLGTTFISMAQFVPAENLLRQAQKILLHVQPINRIELAMTQSRLAEALLGLRKRDEADRLIEAALPVLQNEGGEHTEVAIALNNLGVVRQLQHRYDEALALLTTSVESVRLHCGAEHPLLLRPLNNLAVVYEQAGRDAEADAVFREAQAICERHLPPAHPSHTALLVNYAAFLRRTGEKSRAKAMEEEARLLNRDNVRAMGGFTVDVSGFRGK